MRTGNGQGRPVTSRKGSAAVIAVLAVVVLVGLCGAMLMTALRSNDERGTAVDRHQALATAQAGVAHALVQLAATGNADVGAPDLPMAFGGGSYWVEGLEDPLTQSYTVSSYATVRGETEAVEALLTTQDVDIYDHALFAGNTSGDPLYDMTLSGDGAQGDQVVGDVYSGGGVAVSGSATVTGTIRAQDAITGASGESGVWQPVPDIAAMDYPNMADFKIAELFRGASYRSDDAGGRAWQVPESNPAHIFRRNPSDRASDIGSTLKDDYFLEDPYEPVNLDSNMDGSNAYPISLSGISGEPGVNGNNKVYFIDGNLWVHNKKTFSFKFEHEEANGVQITFVAKGNIYFSDNIFYDDPSTDGVAFIAMNDGAVADSGNIYFGDPVFGTLEQMSAFMYAENDFKDTNLDASGSATVTVHGNMTAGDQVVINRDFNGEHSKLTVLHDDRISTGDLDMPGLPTTDEQQGGGFQLVAWRKIAHP